MALSLLIIGLLSTSVISLAVNAQTTGRASGVDLRPTTIDFDYTDSANTSNYQMFSSNHPILNFNRPKNMFVVDAMLGVEIQITATVENIGTTASGTFDVTFIILHNEYDGFELFNTTVSGGSIGASSSVPIVTTWIPDYSGNHTMEIIASPAFVVDDNPSNDKKTRHMTVGYHYDNCLDLSSWTAGTQWGVSSDTSTSHGQSCHIGNGELSTYSNNLATELIMPKMDMSDGIEAPNRISGISFFYSGGAASGDVLSIHVTEKTGGWTQLATITGVVDNDPLDGSDNWRTFSFANGGHNSPLIPIDPARHIHANTQFKFRFDSDASSQDMGYFLDEIVILYDQKPRVEEFDWDITGISGNSGYAGDSEKVSFEITNSGNLTDRFLPSVSGIPSDWTSHFTYTGGGSVNMQNGVELKSGESRWIDLNLLSDVNDTAGSYPYQFTVTSMTHNSVSDSAATSFQILPNRHPEVRPAETNPICAVGSTCGFSVEVANTGEANDIFNLELTSKNLPQGWNIQFDWNQPSQIFVRAGNSEYVALSVSVPTDAIPDSTASMWLEATSLNQSSRSDKKIVTVAAGMVSQAEIALDMNPPETIDPGDSLTLTYRLWNNATRQDIFLIDKGLVTGAPTWSVEIEELPELPVNPGSSITFDLVVTVPESAQAGDQGPMIRPKAVSQKSGQEIYAFPFADLKAGTLEDIEIAIVSGIERLIPGNEMVVTLEVENKGNGAASVSCSTPNLPTTWTSWMRIEGYNSSSLELSAPFDLGEVGQVEMVFVSPANEAAGEIVNLTITCTSGDSDLTPDDNTVYINAIVSKSKKMLLTIEETTSSATVSGEIGLNATIANIGNSFDNTIRVKVEVLSSPTMEFTGVLGRLDGKGELTPLSEWMEIPMDQGAELQLMVQVMIPESAPLDSRITLTYTLESNRTDDSQDVVSASALFIVDNRSHLEIEWPVIPKNVIISKGKSVDLLINLTSMSTYDQILTIDSALPDGWYINCGDLSIEDDITVKLDSLSGARVDEKLLCTLSRESGDYSGKVSFTAISEDARVISESEIEIKWEKKAEAKSEVFSSQNMTYGGIGGGVILLLLLLTLLIRKSKDEDEDEEMESKAQVNMAQASMQPVAQISESPQEKHQRELEEYQRKVAEYEAQMAAWEASQASSTQVEQEPQSQGPPATMGPPATTESEEVVAETMDVSKAFDVL